TGNVGFAVRARRVDWPHGAPSGTEGYGYAINSNADARVQIVGTSFDTETRSHFGVLYRSTVTDNLYFAMTGYRGYPLTIATLEPPSGSSTVGGAACYDDDHDRHILVHAADDAVVQRLWGYSPAQPWSTAGIGCSTATIGWDGSQQIGSEFSG